jgi:hypothetical protein
MPAGAVKPNKTRIRKTTMYVRASKDSNWELGAKLGMKGEALHYFSYALAEVKVEVEVDTKTGKVKILKVDGVPLADLKKEKPAGLFAELLSDCCNFETIESSPDIIMCLKCGKPCETH